MKVHSSRDIPEHTKDFQVRIMGNPRFDLLDHNSLCEISNDSHRFSSLKKFQSKDEIEEIETNKSCSLCKTQKTPLWRNGPNGPKSLCNACGIRYKKLGKKPDQDSLKRIQQKRKQNMEIRNTDRDVKKIFQRNFTKDEEEGAFLLIGLSCGLVNA